MEIYWKEYSNNLHGKHICTYPVCNSSLKQQGVSIIMIAEDGYWCLECRVSQNREEMLWPQRICIFTVKLKRCKPVKQSSYLSPCRVEKGPANLYAHSEWEPLWDNLIIVSKRQDRVIGGRREGRFLSTLSLFLASWLRTNILDNQWSLCKKKVWFLNHWLRSINFSRTQFEIASSPPTICLKGRGKQTIFNGPFSSKPSIVFRFHLRNQNPIIFNDMLGKAVVGVFISPNALDFK